MIQIIEKVNSMVNNFIWGVPAMVCIFGVWSVLSIRTGFLQIRKFPYAIRTTIGTDLPQTECFRWCADSVSGCLYGTGGNGRYRKYRRRCGRDRDRWTGRGVLDVDFCDPRHVYEVWLR